MRSEWSLEKSESNLQLEIVKARSTAPYQSDQVVQEEQAKLPMLRSSSRRAREVSHTCDKQVFSEPTECAVPLLESSIRHF